MHCIKLDMQRVQEILSYGVAEFPVHYLEILLWVYKLMCVDK
jgi:hypothetical protein